MAKIKNKKGTSKISGGKVKNGIFDKIKFTESYTSLVLGAIVIVIVGILLLFFAGINRNSQTSSIKDNLKTDEESNTSSTYTVNPGDSLWTISENVYQDGYKWVEIAKTNKLGNPELIHAGNKLIIPTVSPVIVGEKPTTLPETQMAITENTSIKGSTYTIKRGDNLWNIAIRAYGDGFRWPDIAKANKLENPNLIFSDNILKIPR